MKHILLAVLLAASSWPAAAESDIRVEDAWVREAPPTARMLAAYMRLVNDGSRERVLIAAQSPAFAHVMIHESRVVDGVARMMHLDEIPLPPHGEVRLEPGGMHLMMPAPAAHLSAGDRVPFVLVFRDGSRIEVQAEVRKEP